MGIYEPRETAAQQPLTIAIAPGTIVLAVLVVAAVWLVFRLTDFLTVLMFAILLATAVDQPVGWLQRRGVPRPVGILPKRGRLELLFFGFIRPYKGLDVLFDALTQLGDA